MSLRWRVGMVTALVLLFGWLSAANFISKADRLESDWLPDDGLRLGLDLQGGIHWVVGVDLKTAIDRELDFVRKNISDDLAEQGVTLDRDLVEDGQLFLQAGSAADGEALSTRANDSGVLQRLDRTGNAFRYTLTEDWQQEIRERTMLQVLEVLRRRIDDPVRGIPDSVVTRQGDDRVLVQIPGGQIDRSRAKKLLASTGFLELKIVVDQDVNEDLLLARYPDGIGESRGIVFERNLETGRSLAAYLVPKAPDLTGDYLEDARQGFDQQQRPIVTFRFSPEGGELFGELTEANINKPMAIILDGNVYSAPTIRSRITTRGEISGRFTSQEAADLAVVLRAGALSVPTVIEEERTIGPALGQDSIDSGINASIVGLLLILAFAVGYYRLSGGYAALALGANLTLLIGLMSLFEATLTLPGIAGLVLTVGMAVDANVIIFERIREELRAGKNPRTAIATGFSKALWTVLDANITTLITAIILFEFGTGPIKGFAVTLSVGIVTSVFTALVVTRMLFHIYPGNRTVAEISI
ncbi:MAG: protein translocase subunit SecD [Myxococcota bacterium]